MFSNLGFFGITHAAGYLVWRDWINEQGGVCLSKKGGQSACTENDKGENLRYKVSMRVVDWAKDESEEIKEKFLKNEILKICERDEKQKPHIIIAPYGHKFGEISK